MPYRLTEHRSKIQFVTHASVPSLIFRAAQAVGLPSNTAYIQRAVCEALARDLGLDLDDLIDLQPPHKGLAQVLIGPNRRPIPRDAAH